MLSQSVTETKYIFMTLHIFLFHQHTDIEVFDHVNGNIVIIKGSGSI